MPTEPPRIMSACENAFFLSRTAMKVKMWAFKHNGTLQKKRKTPQNQPPTACHECTSMVLLDFSVRRAPENEVTEVVNVKLHCWWFSSRKIAPAFPHHETRGNE